MVTAAGPRRTSRRWSMPLSLFPPWRRGLTNASSKRRLIPCSCWTRAGEWWRQTGWRCSAKLQSARDTVASEVQGQRREIMQQMRSLIRIAVGITAVGLLAPLANAQWSLLAPGTREGSPGNNRYYYLVWASPVPGMETQFNDWYQNNHMGDLVQLPGWVGAQRFRIVADVGTRPTRI